MSDRLSLSLWLRGTVSLQNQYRALDKVLRAFPFSKLATGASTLSLLAVNSSEPPVGEYALEPIPDVDEVLRLAREFKEPDSAVQLDAYWDLWGILDGDWKLLPAPLSIIAYGPEFDREEGEDLRIEFGTETRFLPLDGGEGLLMVQANIKSLLRLVHEIDDLLPIERRLLSTESAPNFAARLQDVLSSVTLGH